VPPVFGARIQRRPKNKRCITVIDKVIAHIDSEQKRSAERLLDFLRIPSISTDPARKADVARCANWVLAFFESCGIECALVETPGHPAVIADSGPAEGGGPIVLVYGHYDVQPTGDAKRWETPAFEPAIRNGNIYARGAADDKGQIFTHMLAAEAWKKTAGTLPIHVKFLIEGEEEIGSPNLGALIEKHRDRLTCDYVAISDTAKLDDGSPAITYGTKGLVYKEIHVFGPKQDLHSGSFGGTVENPGNALASIIHSLKDADHRVTIPGYYDDVRPVSDDERAGFARLPFREADYQKMVGSLALVGEKGFSILECRWARPTLDVNGIFGGFTGEGASTIIPAKMSAKVSMRIVPDQDPERISQAFDDAVQAATPPGVRVEIKTHANCAAYVSPLGSPGMDAAAKAVESGYGKRPVLIREGGSLPILPLFRSILGADSIMLGFAAPDANVHGPNEFFALADLHNGTKSAAHLPHYLAAKP
jgi:acetylornithine deacetylase/succinyl-diaminopimelate desuccinylase-like protein